MYSALWYQRRVHGENESLRRTESHKRHVYVGGGPVLPTPKAQHEVAGQVGVYLTHEEDLGGALIAEWRKCKNPKACLLAFASPHQGKKIPNHRFDSAGVELARKLKDSTPKLISAGFNAYFKQAKTMDGSVTMYIDKFEEKGIPEIVFLLHYKNDTVRCFKKPFAEPIPTSQMDGVATIVEAEAPACYPEGETKSVELDAFLDLCQKASDGDAKKKKKKKK
eukprot:Trichotokara_eunicae@DN4347_c0_g1_i7.p1